MLRHTYEGQDCNLARTLEVVGERWTLLIVRSALLGIKRFDGFLGNLDIARNVLTNRLTRLVEHGIMERVPYQDRPVRYEYQLTPAGRDLTRGIIALMQWGDRHLDHEQGPPRRADHIGCEGTVHVELHCGQCGRRVHDEEVDVRSIR
ncbi:winged helix-turn-helix transcriptional regulator [Streptomyces antarcticus]|uniref:winged helix-turn-helix transcriptional regulator n=1 Tax=Streptomyces antarcticus TaxID=2996458 RepID=UPI00226F811A|nr:MULTISPECIES: helix-turn-helix domain-containing protein [unclassified Streptomyces]MCY0942899.1 helix-turn-helix domain-containing protein [Streptomyces sp. H34-AA3]MCY0953054.1 helix-turn-helix domain-containing protein [Streptomyces sp. H27-S2]MCZ4083141.1 helix-turn-helix domain-containing protein [Streptomyces sp. H34-S5]